MKQINSSRQTELKTNAALARVERDEFSRGARRRRDDSSGFHKTISIGVEWDSTLVFYSLGSLVLAETPSGITLRFRQNVDNDDAIIQRH